MSKKYYNIHRYRNDWLVGVLIIFVMGIIYGSVLLYQRSVVKEGALIYELRTIRMAVMTFKEVNKRYPTSLDELSDATFYTPSGAKRPYIPDYIIQRGIKDPFDNRYLYDPARGWVKSSTHGYERW